MSENNDLCLIVSYHQEQREETIINTAYFKRAFYDRYSSDLLVLEFADFKIYHQYKSKINLRILLEALKGNEINLQNLE